MSISVFDIFKIGIGPSSSHTVGPMKAAAAFVRDLDTRAALAVAERVQVEFFGSLGLTGIGHGADKAVILGLMGLMPDGVDPDAIPGILARARSDRAIELLGRRRTSFDETRDLLFRTGEALPGHSNAMRFSCFAANRTVLHQQIYYSVGGGFVVTEQELFSNRNVSIDGPGPRFPFASAAALLETAARHGLSIAELVRENERCWRTDPEIDAGLHRLWTAMQACVARGLEQDGILPGGLSVRRRARRLHMELQQAGGERTGADPLAALDWVSLYAMAVNEENAAGGRVVTAPTNGAAGIIPAVLHYFTRFCTGASDDGVHTFLLTATAIASLYKRNASISGAEVGCQGEIGVACSMAAGGLAAALGGTNEQVENAAEIGMEHNLGLTCDPVKGLVQIPCIERNAVGAVKAINAARLALRGDGAHHVSLDQVIKTMRETGADMQSKYKETSLGGLAANMTVC